MSTNLVKLILKLSKKLSDMAAKYKENRLAAITKEQEKVLEDSAKKIADIEKQLAEMIKTAERNKESASELATEKHANLVSEYNDLKNL